MPIIKQIDNNNILLQSSPIILSFREKYYNYRHVCGVEKVYKTEEFRERENSPERD